MARKSTPAEVTPLCTSCTALCCRYFALPIDNPREASQYDDIEWYLCHENVVVFIEERQWYVGILNKCKELQDDNRCGRYARRPRICRGYTTGNCEYHGGDYNFERLFTSAEDLRRYAREVLKHKRKRNRTRAIEARPSTRNPAKRKG